MLILVTNDDGILSPGIQVLAERLNDLGEVVVVAPDRERSAVGHSLTLHSPLRAEEVRPGFFAIDGTPTDCVNLGIHGLLSVRPDLVVSGINRGGNLGDDITYSGTVAAAFEATLMGVPAFAVSLAGDSFSKADFLPAADFALSLGRLVQDRQLPPDTFLNVNVPPGRPAGVRLTRQGKRVYGDVVVENIDPRGRKYYWIGGGDLGFKDIEGTDFSAIQDRCISVTPLHLDLTNYRSFSQLEGWGLDQLRASAPDAGGDD
ncbi:5'-nucleotidase SurE [Desulfuromonas versatilis]|uniref:5'-nucleotidase SurE n=1 Tax=Desulfuromonas versatilis TaxID=2802975 RepID=A0ABN6DYG7_9BACT|nr:5'/3'-nucleotidase SurE [Desulfuromonas versatilis]BCR05100.1 5'-nucleotidase SurE [Desulfuromonas versatilis]